VRPDLSRLKLPILLSIHVEALCGLGDRQDRSNPITSEQVGQARHPRSLARVADSHDDYAARPVSPAHTRRGASPGLAKQDGSLQGSRREEPEGIRGEPWEADGHRGPRRAS